jgi:hypothetical protein
VAKKITSGWVLRRPPKGGMEEQWIYSRSGVPYRRRSDAIKQAERWRSFGWEVEVYHVSYFYELADGE